MKDKTLFEDFVDNLVQNNYPRQYFQTEYDKLRTARTIATRKLADARANADRDKIAVYREKLVMIRKKEIALSKKAAEMRRTRNNNRPATEKTKQLRQAARSRTGG